ncbi:MAG TPA: hypothetical protein VE593_12050 [Nitrososphaeraceae archaeon]|nr:hypothetical protein [Nitrososphaeraceae archaeon]
MYTLINHYLVLSHMFDNNNDRSYASQEDRRGEGVASSSSNQANDDQDNNNNTINKNFSFKYTESGGLTARYLLISFDSNTNTLSSSTDISGSNLSQKTVPDSDKQELKDTIMQNNFFECKADYPPEKEDDPSLIAYSLAITIGDKTHTTAWTSTSKERPDSIANIVASIRRITAKEKVV